MIETAIQAAVAGEALSPDVVEAAFDQILAGDASEAQIAALLIALRMKGETGSEIAAAARVLRSHCESIAPEVNGPLIDTCGTGGDGLDTFNISTAAAVVVAACGGHVAKHGNRAVSSKSGSADVLESLGVRIELSAEQVCRSIEQVGIGFMFAPAHHAAMRHAAPVRRQLGVRSIFNLLGPLANPANATHQVVGVFHPARTAQLAHALGELGVQRAWVVHGAEGMDEVSPCGVTQVAELRGGVVESRSVSPADYGLEQVSPGALRGGDAVRNAEIIRNVFAGEHGAPRAAVLINAASALFVAGLADDLKNAATQAAKAIDSGAAREKLAEWVAFTQSQGPPP